MTDPRDLWQPALGEFFGLRPWDMERVTVPEYNRMCEYLTKRADRG